MRIATTLALFNPKHDGSFFSAEETLRNAHKAGFRVIDADLTAFPQRKGYCHFLDTPDWERRTQELRELGDSLGVVFNQAHLPYYPQLETSGQEFEHAEEMTRRAIIACRILGVPWGVMHAGSISDRNWSLKEHCERNVEYFKPKIEAARKNNTGIAIENMGCWPRSKWFRMYCATEYELCELVDTLNDPAAGICWDFGHANMNKLDQALSLRTIGKRLKAVHVQDNRGWEDDHLPPFCGTVDWPGLMPVLAETGYAGDLTFEVLGMEKFPDAFRVEAAHQLLETGRFLLELYKGQIPQTTKA
ncbi:MAG: sugar phosphate isomerase/epimerase [Treponema sp.]|jgi:sugar phosphate isomerase/epimerase|nr:sugar phosphate isomerase/epimerase [Treponema sp.]